MNSADHCHSFPDCPGLYVDAFRGHFLQRTRDAKNTFILTHYHGDHYQNLPRHDKYQGPAKIHCTPITAALLGRIHGVPPCWVVAHDYGVTWELGSNQITFYDANHCPGACLVLLHTQDGKTHLHTGDMRYHARFQSYPLLQRAVNEKRLDLVYLDTTYSHPKHAFGPQEDAISQIAQETQGLLLPRHGSSGEAASTLVLLSCYSIGKERVLWQAAKQSCQKIYVTEKKWKMLECIQEYGGDDVFLETLFCKDPNQSDLHVIPMGLAGETWPFFRPNFQKCADYALELTKQYTRVVAFVPTGWANASKWNQEHAVNRKTVMTGDHALDVEVRLVAYSEHSSFNELVEFVQFLKPRKVIPTVFADAADRRKIEDRFRNLLDQKRAKQAFFESMMASKDTSIESLPKSTSDSENVIDTQSKTASAVAQLKPNAPNDETIDILTAMGFERKMAIVAVQQCDGAIEVALELLLSGSTVERNDLTPTRGDVGTTPSKRSSPTTSSPSKSNCSSHELQASSPSKKKQCPSPPSALITSFFSPKRKGN